MGTSTTKAATTAVMTANQFPLGQTKHIIFSVIACLFFLIQFKRTGRWYQLVMAVAVPLSLLIYIQPESSTLFYGVGIAEAVLLLLAFVLNIVQSVRTAKAEKTKKQAETEETTETADTPVTEEAASEE